MILKVKWDIILDSYLKCMKHTHVHVATATRMALGKCLLCSSLLSLKYYRLNKSGTGIDYSYN